MKYQGCAASRGVAIANIFCYNDQSLSVEEQHLDEALRREEVECYHAAITKAERQLEEVYEHCARHDADKAKIFQAHIDILQDVQVREEVETAILEEGKCAQWAVASVYGIYAEVFAGMEDPIMRERAADLKDVSDRLQRALLNAPPAVSLADLPENTLLVAHDLIPSQTVTLDSSRVAGIVTEIGGMTSHTAILARSFGIPAVLGIPGILGNVSDGMEAILDCREGILITKPSAEQLSLYRDKQEEFKRVQDYERAFLPMQPVTLDGKRISVNLNIGDPDDTHYRPFLPYVDGVGLFRSEFLYLSRKELPSEDEQYEIYSRTLRYFGTRPVILRTLDIGGDKKTECITIPQEDNPFLGLRALRLCFAMPGLFRTQLRAAFRAAVNGNLWIMFPMVNSIEDIRKAKAFCRDVCDELEREGKAFRRDVPIGIMIETPSIALMAEEAAEECDFCSIGSNDLCQYTMAVDRMSPIVRPYYMSYHPSVLRLINMIIKAFTVRGKTVGICGELGGDPKIVPVLIGMGMEKLSMSPSAVASVKSAICNLDSHKARQLAEKALSCTTEEEVKALL